MEGEPDQVLIRDLGPVLLDEHGASRAPNGAVLGRLLGRLLVEPGGSVEVGALVDAAWGEAGAGRSASTLDSHLSRLRRFLGPAMPLVRTAAGYRLALAAAQVDSARFAVLLDEARRALGAGTAAAAVESALRGEALWRGRPLSPWSDEPWAATVVARLEELHRQLADVLVDALLGAGRVDEALVRLEPLLAQEPLRERPWAQYMQAAARVGRVEDALAAFRRVDRLYRDELGVEVGGELRGLHAELLAGDPTPSRPAPSRPAVPVSRPRPGPPLVGRGPEREAVRAAVRGVLDGRPAVVWVEGEAGAGKSALVDALVGDLPAEFGVLRAEADELDVDEPFALVAQIGAASAVDLLAAWSAAQDGGPLAVVVEDLHWADPDSRRALLTAVRRLAGDRVLVLVASRPGATDGWARFALDARRCLRLDVGALSATEVGELATLHGVGLSRRAAERLHAHTEGHALHVRTLLTELTPAQLTRRDGALPAPRTLAATTTAALTALPTAARDLAAALATVARPVPVPVAARIAGVSPDAADALVDSGLARLEDEDLCFAHPLYRVAVWDDLAPSRRRALHRAAAAELRGREALTHRVAAAEGPDEGLAAELRAAASGLGRVPAAHLLLAAARVAERPDEPLLEGVALLVAAGRMRQAADHRAAVEACEDGPGRDLVLGMLDWESGDAGAAEASLRRAVADTSAIGTAATVRLATLQYTGGRGAEAVASAERALAGAGLTADDEREAWTALAVGEQMRSGAVAGLARLAPRLPAVVTDPADTDLLVTRGTLQFFAARPASAVVDLTSAIHLSHAASSLSGDRLTRAHLQLANAQILTGDWAAAAIHARLASGLVEDEDLVWVRAQTEAIHARLAGCVHGDWAAAEAHLQAAGEAVGTLGSLEAAFTTLIARVMVADAREDPREILAVFGGLVANAMPVPMSTALTWWPMIVDAALDVGDLDTAEDLLARLRVAADERAIDLEAVMTGLDARVAEARGDLAAALAGYERAIAGLGPEVVLLDRGKLLHRHGGLLFARGDRAGARERWEAALTVFAHARPYEARVRRDLERVAAVPSSPAEVPGLTEREREVVALVATGMTNKEAAAALYLTDKAVEYHLGNVYSKLGIRSRRELRSLASHP